MSLILDALRKSEAERRRGQVPDLRAELPPLVRATAPVRRTWPLWLAGGAVLLVAAALLVARWSGRATDARDGSAQVDSSGPVAAPASRESSIAAPVEPPMTAAPPTAKADAPAATARVPAAPIAERMPETPTAASAPSTAGPDPIAQVEPAAAASIEPPPAQAPSPILPAPVAPPLPVQTTAAAPPSTLRLADLSPGEREQLPALKISMHMWGPTPDQRFAIIDGARVGQGDRVGDAVVEEIAADGVVLNWHGRRVALPLR